MVTPPPGVTPEQIAQAEMLVAAELGLGSLERATATHTGRARGSTISLPTPASELLSVMSGEDELSGAELCGACSVRVSVTTPVEITYRTGWTAQTLPAQIRSAVIMTAQGLAHSVMQELPPGVQSVRLSEISLTFSEKHMPTGGVPTAAARLLSPWKPVRW